MSASGSFQRPLLALVDRQVDMTAVLQHTWTYQALVHDLMDYHKGKLNRVFVFVVLSPLESPLSCPSFRRVDRARTAGALPVVHGQPAHKPTPLVPSLALPYHSLLPRDRTPPS